MSDMGSINNSAANNAANRAQQDQGVTYRGAGSYTVHGEKMSLTDAVMYETQNRQNTLNEGLAGALNEIDQGNEKSKQLDEFITDIRALRPGNTDDKVYERKISDACKAFHAKHGVWPLKEFNASSFAQDYFGSDSAEGSGGKLSGKELQGFIKQRIGVTGKEMYKDIVKEFGTNWSDTAKKYINKTFKDSNDKVDDASQRSKWIGTTKHISERVDWDHLGKDKSDSSNKQLVQSDLDQLIESLTASQTQIGNDQQQRQLRIQNLMHQAQETQDLASALEKVIHDTAMAPIHNMI